MPKTIGIRREDKNEWERRAPLIPEDIRWLKEQHGIQTLIQPSPIRIFPIEEYLSAGARESKDLSGADVIFAVKEIPEKLFRQGKTYVFFSHTIKGQHHNMPMLRRMMERGCNLIDYERVNNEQNQRLIFFGRHAGLAGMVDTLHAFGQKLKLLGYQTPFARIRQAYQYPSLEAAKAEISRIGEEIDERGIPIELCPLVIGLSGYGHVSQGAQEIFDLLPHKMVSADALLEMSENFAADTLNLFKVVFKEDDLVRRKEGVFELQEYYDHPERYESKFENYLPQLSILVNCIFWSEKYPRLVTKRFLRDSAPLSSSPKLKVIGDISCDINGSVEITHKATPPDQAFYTYFPQEDRSQDGIQRLGVTVMAVDNLPCEFSREASQEFSAVLRNFVPAIAQADFRRPGQDVQLPPAIKKALILQGGKLTADYAYMEKFLS